MVKLNTFQVRCGSRNLTPQLITARSFGNWFRSVFSENLCRKYLYVGSKKKGSEYHPGSRIGQYFEANCFKLDELNSWYIPKDSEAFSQLVQKKLASLGDVAPVRKNSKLSGYLRCFTLEQIELFIREVVKDSGIEFELGDIATAPRIIRVFYQDSKLYVFGFKPRVPLFSINLNNSEPTEIKVPMTLSEVENVLGHKILLVSEKGDTK